MKKIIFNQDELDNIYQLYYNEGKSFRELEEIYHCSQTVFDRTFKEQNWQPHKQYYKMIKYSVNDHYFDIIDNPDKAYCLGLWYADGCNYLDRGDIRIELQIDDLDVLQQINKLVDNTNPIKICSSKNRKTRKKDTCVLNIHSHHMCEVLNDYNFIPRKSLTLDFPYWMDKKLIPYMLRGYIDGDGWIQQYRIGFMSTDKFCKGVKDYFDSIGLECHIRDMKRHYDEHTKTFDISGRKNLIPLTSLMFAEGNIFMQRKVDKYIQYGFLKEFKNNSLIA